MSKDGYNGWENWETWNVALWINNVEPYYRAVRAKAKQHDADGQTPKYAQIVEELILSGALPRMTEDGVSFRNPKLDYAALNEMLAEDIA